MGGAINRSFISAHFLLNTYFLTVQTYKCMRLITRVYGMTVMTYVNVHAVHSRMHLYGHPCLCTQPYCSDQS